MVGNLSAHDQTGAQQKSNGKNKKLSREDDLNATNVGQLLT